MDEYDEAESHHHHHNHHHNHHQHHNHLHRPQLAIPIDLSPIRHRHNNANNNNNKNKNTSNNMSLVSSLGNMSLADVSMMSTDTTMIAVDLLDDSSISSINNSNNKSFLQALMEQQQQQQHYSTQGSKGAASPVRARMSSSFISNPGMMVITQHQYFHQYSHMEDVAMDDECSSDGSSSFSATNSGGANMSNSSGGTAVTGKSRYKTELCRSFEETGYCRYGDKCQFAHGRSELRTVSRHQKYKSELCTNFHDEGQCLYGIRCCFVHKIQGDNVGLACSQDWKVARVRQENRLEVFVMLSKGLMVPLNAFASASVTERQSRMATKHADKSLVTKSAISSRVVCPPPGYPVDVLPCCPTTLTVLADTTIVTPKSGKEHKLVPPVKKNEPFLAF